MSANINVKKITHSTTMFMIQTLPNIDTQKFDRYFDRLV